jgi:ferredoxin
VKTLRVIVDYELCESNALCMQAAPEVFELDGDDKLRLLQEEPPEALCNKIERAVRLCPKGALSLERIS